MRKTLALRSKAVRGLLAFATLTSLTALVRADDESGAVYVLSNQVANNAVLVFGRAPGGSLSYSGSFPTGGAGTGPLAATGAPFLDPLASQGSLALHAGLLFAVNGGSNEISMFGVDGQELELLDKVPSGGERPVSIAVNGDYAYVLNQGSATLAPNITGFVIDRLRGHLVPLGSQRPLAGGVGANPAEVSFNDDGTILVVTEKGTNIIDTFRVDAHGIAGAPASFASSGSTPFGFSLTHRGVLVVSDAASGAATSYHLGERGKLSLLSGPVSNGGQAAPCWLLTTRDGRFAFEANAGSSTIASFAVASDGTLTLLNSSAAAAGGGFLDMALSPDGRFLFVRDGIGSVFSYALGTDGKLTAAGSLPSGSIPFGSQGIAAR
jgi:6-phosphogluconolactonase (cycloisomerase 2 family)